MALSTESFARSQQSTSAWTIASKLSGRNGRCRALATTARVRSAVPSASARRSAARMPGSVRSDTTSAAAGPLGEIGPRPAGAGSDVEQQVRRGELEVAGEVVGLCAGS